MITPEQFMATPQPDEEDAEAVDPLGSIAESLRTIAAAYDGPPAAVTREDELQQALDQADAEYQDLMVRNGVLAGRLEEIRALVKPSTSKLANSIREVLDADDTVEVVDAEGSPEEDEFRLGEHPADDAPVEVWRRYGRWRGLDLVDNLNRSQIRSALGIPQPVIEAGE